MQESMPRAAERSRMRSATASLEPIRTPQGFESLRASAEAALFKIVPSDFVELG